jgi:glyoxylase-like metal-dependent hydrolase (beta-lactamase superfamily II)
MISIIRMLMLISLISPFIPLASYSSVESITENVTVIHDAVNGVLINQQGKTLAIYGDPRDLQAPAEKVLFTHHRRDVVWAGASLVKRGAEAYIPQGEKELFTNTQSYWQKKKTSRFHDYEQQTTKVLGESFKDVKTVKGGDTVEWQGLDIHVLDTPGYTRKAVSYLFQIDGKRIACVGDLIYGDGKILDLYSFQDSITKPKAMGYHGYMSRVADLIASLETVRRATPDILIPTRGPVIDKPVQAIDKLIGRLKAVYENHLSINALRWYYGDEHITGCAGRILGTTNVDWMPIAETVQPYPPKWVIPFGTSRLILSEDGDGFLIDCGSSNAIKEIRKLKKDGRLKSLYGIYVTHYHDDHTNFVEKASAEFGCRVFFCREQQDILEHPQAYYMPAQTDQAISNTQVMPEGEKMRWKEFEFTFSYFPGQTLYHGGLLIKKIDGETIFFIGDSFSPTGIDDYCMLNRNLLHPDTGYFYCLDTLKRMKPDYCLVNQHIKEPFRFSPKQLEFMIDTLEKRVALLQDLLPWDNVNYGIDHQWVRFYPYGIEAQAGQRNELKVVIFNHSSREQTFSVTPRVPRGWNTQRGPLDITIPPREERTASVYVTPAADAKGVSIITADISFGEWNLRQFTEAIVSVTN